VKALQSTLRNGLFEMVVRVVYLFQYFKSSMFGLLGSSLKQVPLTSPESFNRIKYCWGIVCRWTLLKTDLQWKKEYPNWSLKWRNEYADRDIERGGKIKNRWGIFFWHKIPVTSVGASCWWSGVFVEHFVCILDFTQLLDQEWYDVLSAYRPICEWERES
jgi:hypothetical protein